MRCVYRSSRGEPENAHLGFGDGNDVVPRGGLRRHGRRGRVQRRRRGGAGRDAAARVRRARAGHRRARERFAPRGPRRGWSRLVAREGLGRSSLPPSPHAAGRHHPAGRAQALRKRDERGQDRRRRRSGWATPGHDRRAAPPGPRRGGRSVVAAADVHLRAAGARRTVLGRSRVPDEWAITLEEPYTDVHPGNLVYRCRLRDGTPAVIKAEPDRAGEDEFQSGIDALVLYAGRGMVRVLRTDRKERIVLMEKVVPGEPLWREPIERALEAAASVMSKLRSRPPDRPAFPDVRAYHHAWPNHIRLYGGPGPIDADLFEMGERLFLDLCESSAEPVVLHGDLHYGNVLSSERDGWLAIDPKGVTGEPCYEVGDLFRNRVDELYETADPVQAMRGRVEQVADLTGFDAERVRRWALAQAVLSEVWTADDPSRASDIDMRATRLLNAVGPLG